VNPPYLFPDQGDVLRRLLLPVFCLAALSKADLAWSFLSPDLRPGAIGGVYGYVYPSAKSPGQTALHTASLALWGTNTDEAARMSFHLDGKSFPAAGFGLMFDNADPIDMRSMTSIRMWIRADRPRKVRFSLAPADSILKIAADTGVTFGRDTTIGTEWSEWVIRAEDLAWPRWAKDLPASRREEILSRVFALQFDVGCEAKDGVCQNDSGHIDVDDVLLAGAGGRWNAPAEGDCSGDTLWIDRFDTDPARQNNMGGWWYAYTDRTSSDTSARGMSQIVNASNPDSAETWLGPSVDSGVSSLAFNLRRWHVYSGYAAMETQLAAPDMNSKPLARSYKGAAAISFRIDFAKDFPDAMGGAVVHLRKKGQFFENGRDHQLQIPIDSVARDWCLDLSSFKQPSWSEWIEPFTPDSLLALSFEVRLPSSLDQVASSFRVSRIAFHGEMLTGVGARLTRGNGRLLRMGQGWVYVRSTASPVAIPWTIRNAEGRQVAVGVLPERETSLSIPATSRGISILTLGAPEGRTSFKILQP